MKKSIYISIILIAAFFLGKSIYEQINKKTAKTVRIECHKNSTVFEKVLKPQLLENLQNDIKKGDLSVSIEIEKAKYMQSELFKYVNPQNVKEQFESIAKIKNNESKNKVNILIYENDKNDPGKKTAKSKLYAGYLVFSFKVENALVYKLQIDFFDLEGKDIQKVLECAYESIISIKGEEK